MRQVHPANQRNMNIAVMKVMSKTMSIIDAAKSYRVPVMTLWNKVLNVKSERVHDQVLTIKEEREVCVLLY